MKFQVDGGFLGSVEQRQFFEYLNSHTLYIEVWDGDGLFPVGMCALELRVSENWTDDVKAVVLVR